TPVEEETVEEIPVEVPTTPEGAPEEEEIPVDVPTTPEGAPEEEEDIDVEIPEIPEGDVLPQTGVAGAATFFGFGAAFIGLGAAVICKGIRREEI
ncbi:MAG: LPXTG cell wall anchor domain-containing protein, partial [Lachnospiraceae bacterium]|nr:LPXTG cell wall anchor domain-containing protein [Lachnospiraceae bacterium]